MANTRPSRKKDMLYVSHGVNLVITLTYMFLQAKNGHNIDPTVLMIALGAAGLGHGTANWANGKEYESGRPKPD